MGSPLTPCITKVFLRTFFRTGTLMAFSADPLIFLSFLLIIFVQPYGYRGDSQAVKSHLQTTNGVKVSSLLPPTTCSTSTPSSIKGINGKPLLKISHRNGPCAHSSKGKEKSLEEILLQDEIRVNSLQNRLSNNSMKAEIKSRKSTTLPANTGSSYGSGNYIVHVGFGTPTKSMSLIFDTGSDITWIQCKPCLGSCYNQTDEIFDPSMSTSYSNITCTSAECSLLQSATGNSPRCDKSSSCVYGIQYGDSSFSAGYFVREKVTITPTDVFQNFEFGCGQNNQGLFGKTSGLLGLGRNKLSFVSQTFKKYGGVFSYCLPSKSSSTGYLSLGAEQGGYSSVKFTPMLTDTRGPSFYYLKITSLLVGNQNLAISPSVFTTSGVIIDSGTVITRLPPAAYSALKSAFQQAMSKYPKAKPLSILDTCYDLSAYNDIDVPTIAFVFQGNAKAELPPFGILIGSSASQVCLGFAATSDASDFAIIGNLQQQEMKVVYDIPNKRVGFGPGNCS